MLEFEKYKKDVLMNLMKYKFKSNPRLKDKEVVEFKRWWSFKSAVGGYFIVTNDYPDQNTFQVLYCL